MARKRYSMVANQWLIDMDTMKFVSLSKKQSPCDIFEPRWLSDGSAGDVRETVAGFENVGGQLKNFCNKSYVTNEFQLNDCKVLLRDNYKSAVIVYRMPGTSKLLQLELDVTPNYTPIVNKRGQTATTFPGAGFHLHFAGESKIDYVAFDGVDDDREFRYVPSLGKHQELQCPKKFCYGLVPHQYEVTYKGRLLGGKSYALVCGPWAVLLGDDLRFDALAYLTSCSGYKLSVAKFAHTVNPYIVKVMLMW